MIDSPSLFFFKLFGALAISQLIAVCAQWYLNRKVSTRKDAVRLLTNSVPVVAMTLVAILAQWQIIIGQLIIPTPNLIEPRHLSVAEAQAIVDRSDLVFRIIDKVFHAEIDAQLIVEQSPKPGVYQTRKQFVDVVVSKGPKPSLAILSPTSLTAVAFPAPPAICSTTATGKVTPLRQIQMAGHNLKTYLLLYPLEPYGGGWWVMDEPIDVDDEGNWTCHFQVGSAGAHQPKTGDKFKLRVVVVEDGSDLPRLKEPIVELPSDIVVSSSDVIITVERKQAESQ